MNLKRLTDDELLTNTERLVQEEREQLTMILHHLREVDLRRLFAKLKYPSLHVYAVRHLKYSDDQAYRRISAMRLIKDMPEVEEQIASGELSLTNASKAQSFFRREKSQPQKKKEILKKLHNKSTREADRELVKEQTVVAMPLEREKVVSDDMVQISCLTSNTTLGKIQRLKGLLAHKTPNMSTGDLLGILCDLGLKHLDPQNKIPALPKKSCDINQRRATVELKTKIWKEANSECTNCGSVYALEEDHRLAFALGGKTTAENMRLLCRSCNQRAAIEQLGMKQMEIYLT